MAFALILVGSFLLRVPKVDLNGKMKSVLRKKSEMLWTLGFSLFILWLLGFLGGYTGGGIMYILLAAAIVFVPIEIIWRMRVVIQTLAGKGEVFGKEVVSKSRKILPNFRILGNRREGRSLTRIFQKLAKVGTEVLDIRARYFK